MSQVLYSLHRGDERVFLSTTEFGAVEIVVGVAGNSGYARLSGADAKDMADAISRWWPSAMVREPSGTSDANLRDHFAMAALTGLTAAEWTSDRSFDVIARWAYATADAMLVAREQK